MGGWSRLHVVPRIRFGRRIWLIGGRLRCALLGRYKGQTGVRHGSPLETEAGKYQHDECQGPPQRRRQGCAERRSQAGENQRATHQAAEFEASVFFTVVGERHAIEARHQFCCQHGHAERERRGGGDLRGILVHDSRDPKRPVTMMAEHGALIMSSDGPRFVMANGNRQELEPNRRQLSLLYFENYVLDLGHLAQSPSNRWREASERYIHELFDPGDTLDDINQADKLRAEGHRRIVLPLYAIVLAMIAVTSIIAGPSSRRGQLYRATIAAVFAVVFEIVGLVLLPLVEMAPSLAILMYLHVVIVAAGCIYLMGRRLSRRPPSNQFAEAGT
ncbi:MAG TPA: LptF/LptG family permease [Planctomycetes bacterium]|nr:LptF/LptG family permease [Planctomycetota bacterium]